MNQAEAARLVIDAARRLGFHRVGIVPVEPPRRYQAYRDWLDRGYHAEMAYMAAPEHLAARADLRQLAAGARSIVVVALAYAKAGGDAAPATAPAGFVARYARGFDYHLVLKRKLRALADELSAAIGRPLAARPCVDSAPVLERELAERAGIGFVAKNTMVIAPGLGSYFVLGELLLDVDLAPTAAEPAHGRCGSCRLCLDACPTGAFADAYVLDARRCISYLTIEHRGAIPRELRPAIGQRIFGCDVCQEVCPFNAQAPDRATADAELAPLADDRGALDLLDLIAGGVSAHRRLVKQTALRRVSREQMARNVCVALGNAGDRRAIAPLCRKLADPSPLVRAHAAWALGQLGERAACERALATETDPDVRAELSLVIGDSPT